MNIFLKGLRDNDMEIMQIATKVIAHAIRNEIEDFHVNYLSDAQMKELNPLIRSAIYNTLFALANWDAGSSSEGFIDSHLEAIPEYWEDAKLWPRFMELLQSFQEQPIKFNSSFLDEQYLLGNIYWGSSKRCIQLRGSYEFIGVSDSEGKKFKSKIKYQLGKEGYSFDYELAGYIKRSGQ